MNPASPCLNRPQTVHPFTYVNKYTTSASTRKEKLPLRKAAKLKRPAEGPKIFEGEPADRTPQNAESRNGYFPAQPGWNLAAIYLSLAALCHKKVVNTCGIARSGRRIGRGKAESGKRKAESGAESGERMNKGE